MNIIIFLMVLAAVGTFAGLACGLILGALYAEEILEIVLVAWNS